MTFKTKKLQKLCEQEHSAIRALGRDCAMKLKRRLDDILDADSVQELRAGHPHPLKGDRTGQFALDLHGGKRLLFESDQNPTPVRTDGSIDWSQITQVRIVFIGDYHD
nr:killer suppression protein HigA [Pseudanabaena sp. PCC 7367]